MYIEKYTNKGKKKKKSRYMLRHVDVTMSKGFYYHNDIPVYKGLIYTI